MARRWNDLPQTVAAEARQEKEAEGRDARQAFEVWSKGPGQQLNDVIIGLVDLFPDLPSPLTADPASARAGTESRVLAEKERCNRILHGAAAAIQRINTLDMSIQRSRARLAELDQELPSLSQDAEALASALAGILPHIHGAECPVCLRDFASLMRARLVVQWGAARIIETPG